MRNLIIPAIILFLFMTVKLPAQTSQVSPVSNLDKQNTSVVNNNMQVLQAGVNGAFGLFSQYFSGGILTASHGGTGKDSSAWATGDTVYMSSQGVWGHHAFTWVPTNIQVFTTTGTWTKPTGISNVYVKVVGGGGAGGTVNDVNFGSGGGGGGGYAEGTIAVTGNVTVTIGSTNSFAGSTTIQATSGSAGSNASNTVNVTGGVGGVGSNGTINLTGATGSPSTGGSSLSNGGQGGSSAIGGGGPGGLGAAASSGATGGIGRGYGGGGGGGGSHFNSSSAAAGDPGAVIVYY